jgi:hypothetical protein
VAPTAATHGFADWDVFKAGIEAEHMTLAKEMAQFDAEFAQRQAEMTEGRKAFDKKFSERKAQIQAARVAW